MNYTKYTAYCSIAYAALFILVFTFIGPRSLVAAKSTSSTTQNASQNTRYLSLSKFTMHGIDGPYHTQGNLIIGADKKPYLFHGIGRSALEFDCFGDGHFTAQELSYMGSGKNTASATYWQANTVRLSLNEIFWLKGDGASHCSAQQYQQLVKQTVDTLTRDQMNVMLDLQESDAGGHATKGQIFAMPDADSVTFWKQVATVYKGYKNVLFELYNEPHPPSWQCWQQGCPLTNDAGYSYQAVGMQALVNAARGAGAPNLLLAAGVRWGFDLSQVQKFPLSGRDIAYDTHPYPYPDKMPNSWDQAFGNISAMVPIISAESGEYDCGTSYMSQLLTYFDAHNIGWTGWAWTTLGNTCGYPELITNYNGQPAARMGQYIYQKLHSY